VRDGFSSTSASRRELIGAIRRSGSRELEMGDIRRRYSADEPEPVKIVVAIE